MSIFLCICGGVEMFSKKLRRVSCPAWLEPFIELPTNFAFKLCRHSETCPHHRWDPRWDPRLAGPRFQLSWWIWIEALTGTRKVEKPWWWKNAVSACAWRKLWLDNVGYVLHPVDLVLWSQISINLTDTASRKLCIRLIYDFGVATLL